MPVEALLLKIASAVLKKAAIGGALKWLTPAVEIYSVFNAVSHLTDCIQTTNDCHDLSVCGLEVISGHLADAAVDQLLTIGNTTFEVQRNPSGLFVASSIAPRFAINTHCLPMLVLPTFPKLTALQNLKKKDIGMGDTIIVRCSHCGERIGEISYVPGEQCIGCPECEGQTVVLIEKDGAVFTFLKGSLHHRKPR